MGKIIKQTRTIEHPLEEVFNIDPGTTVVEQHEFEPTELVSIPSYDDKDNEIESQFEEIYTLALGQATIISDETERVEGKYKARVGEVAATMLTVALNAAREKAALKAHKDKMSSASASGGSSGPSTVNNNLIVADRNELLRAILDKNKQ